MKNDCFVLQWCLWGLVGLLTGCATPKPILDLAGQGTATVALAEASLRDYLAITTAQLTARMDLMRLDAQQEVRDASRRGVQPTLSAVPCFLDGLILPRAFSSGRYPGRLTTDARTHSFEEAV